jgi:imidazolonepropionase-like amidohydrolase
VRVLLAGLIVAGAALVSASTEATPSRQQAPQYYITASRLFDGVKVVRGGAAVEVRAGRIVAAGKLRVPTEGVVRVVRLGNATIMPGFIDLHVHESPSVLLREGVTTTRNLGEDISILRPPYAAKGYPRIVAAGPLITVPGGYPTRLNPSIADPITSPAGGVAEVDKLVAKGAALIKIALEDGGNNTLPMLSVAEVEAIVGEAHRLHRIVTAHVLEGPGLAIALAGGVDELAHMPCQEVTPDQMAQLLQRRIPVVATLHVDQLHVTLGSPCRDGLENAKTFVARGGELLYGTDIPGVRAGLDLTELGLMQQAGLSALQVMQAATSNAGAELRMEPLGRLRRDAPADLWAVKGDPTTSLRLLGKPIYVMARGVRIR